MVENEKNLIIHLNKTEKREWEQPQIVQLRLNETKNGATKDPSENNLFTNKVS